MVAAVYDIDAVNLREVVPVMRNNSARKANPGLFPFFRWMCETAARIRSWRCR
jgi:hypothetical protein